jgi:hypothetical protein
MRFTKCLSAALTVGLMSLAQSPSALFAQTPVPVQVGAPVQVPGPIYVPAPIPVPAPVDTGQQVPVLAPNQLDGLVAPIALYPDPLISQILVASSYPLEVVEAYQWLQRNPGLTGQALTEAAAAQNWDPSIQALVMFPEVLQRLNEDVSWTTSLGNAFVNQQADVMSAIQRMRVSAEQSGRLVSTPQQQVISTYDAGQPVVEILPTNPEVIYVPAYDPYWVWGPAYYYPYARWYYPPVRTGFFFGVGIPIHSFIGFGWTGWGGWGWHPSWGSRTLIVNNTFIRQYHFNASRLPAARASVWSYDAFHRRGVPAQAFNSSRGFRGNPAPVAPPARPLGPQQSARGFNRVEPRAPIAVPGRGPVAAPNRGPVAVPRTPAPVQGYREAPNQRFENRAPGAVNRAPGFENRAQQAPPAARQAMPNFSNRNMPRVEAQRPAAAPRVEAPRAERPNFNNGGGQRYEGSHSGGGNQGGGGNHQNGGGNHQGGNHQGKERGR